MGPAGLGKRFYKCKSREPLLHSVGSLSLPTPVYHSHSLAISLVSSDMGSYGPFCGLKKPGGQCYINLAYVSLSYLPGNMIMGQAILGHHN